LLNGEITAIGNYGFSFPFDSAITSDDGIYAVVYQKLGTKGLLLKNGKLVRELNRSYYQATAYEYPIAFLTRPNGETYLIHCPHSYCQIDFEQVETGEIFTQVKERQPSDFFHSRFDVSPDKKTLISRGWVWHPFDFLCLYDIDNCFDDPLLLDESKLRPDVDAELCAASFITNDLVLIGAPNEGEPFDHEESALLKNGQIAIWDTRTNTVSQPITPDFKIGGHLTIIDHTYAWELLDFPKIVNYRTGKVIDKIDDIYTGHQVSSITHHLNDYPKIAINKQTKQVAIYNKDQIDVLTM
jgi:hypothetical protein